MSIKKAVEWINRARVRVRPMCFDGWTFLNEALVELEMAEDELAERQRQSAEWEKENDE